MKHTIHIEVTSQTGLSPADSIKDAKWQIGTSLHEIVSDTVKVTVQDEDGCTWQLNRDGQLQLIPKPKQLTEDEFIAALYRVNGITSKDDEATWRYVRQNRNNINALRGKEWIDFNGYYHEQRINPIDVDLRLSDKHKGYSYSSITDLPTLKERYKEAKGFTLPAICKSANAALLLVFTKDKEEWRTNVSTLEGKKII